MIFKVPQVNELEKFTSSFKVEISFFDSGEFIFSYSVR